MQNKRVLSAFQRRQTNLNKHTVLFIVSRFLLMRQSALIGVAVVEKCLEPLQCKPTEKSAPYLVGKV